MFRSLRVRNYRLYASGQVVSLTGTWMQRVAQDWLVLELSDNSGTALGVVLALQFGPTLLFSLWGGVLADRYDKRTILLCTQSSMIALAAVLGLLDVTGAVQLWHVYLLAGLLGVASALDVPARQSFVVEMVGSADLANAVSLNSATFNSARIVGPALAGVLIAVTDTGWVFLGNAVLTGAVIAGLLLMRPDELHRSPPTGRSPGQLRGGPAVRPVPAGPGAADGAGLRGRHLRAELPGHAGADGPRGLRPRRRGVRAAVHRDRGRLAGRRARRRPGGPAGRPPASCSAPPSPSALLEALVGRDADVRGRGRAAGADRAGRAELHDRRELVRPAGQRPGVPRPGDGALPDVLPGRHPARRAADRRAVRRVRPAGRRVRGRRGVRGRRAWWPRWWSPGGAGGGCGPGRRGPAAPGRGRAGPARSRVRRSAGADGAAAAGSAPAPGWCPRAGAVDA